MKPLFFIFSCLALVGLPAAAQTMGLFQHSPDAQDGYVLFSPIMSTNTYLIDKCGKEVHKWPGTRKPGQSVYLLNDGSLLRTGNMDNPIFTAGGTGGIIEQFSWDGTTLWSYQISDTTQCQHHDICRMPNGNILAIVWEKKTAAQAVAAGRNPSAIGTSLWSEKIIELEPLAAGGANIVWEWHAWDHLVQDYSTSLPGYDTISQHPELININYYNGTGTTADWLHINSVDYNTALNQVLLSNHNFNEIWIIDHSTTTAQAATHIGGSSGHGGDLLYRWGNPAAYSIGGAPQKKFYGQHNAQWVTAGLRDSGNIIVFNNGQGRTGGNYSSVDIIAPPVDAAGHYSYSGSSFLPDTAYWSYVADTPTNFYAANISGMQRLANGNTLICSGPTGLFFEIDTAKNMVWKYVNPVNATGPMTQGASPTQNQVFRCQQYDAAYAGFALHTLTAGLPIELSPLPYDCSMSTPATAVYTAPLSVANPIDGELVIFGSGRLQAATLHHISGRHIASWADVSLATGSAELPLPTNLPQGMYVLSLLYQGEMLKLKVVK